VPVTGVVAAVAAIATVLVAVDGMAVWMVAAVAVAVVVGLVWFPRRR